MERFSQFIREREYLHNVSPATLEWYKHSFKWLPSESPTQDELKNAVLRMREKGLKATGCNSAIRAINSYLHWCDNPDIKCSPACRHLRIAQLKEPTIILPTFATADIHKLARWKPKGFHEARLHVLVLTLMDIGSRITETLELKWADVDFYNLLMKLHGKGDKERMVPFSFELRRHLFKWKKTAKHDLVFPTHDGQRIDRRNALRDVKLLCKELGITPPARTLHAIRHTFGANYVRRGGSVFHLQKCLGHSTLEMSRRYANLLTEDLQAVHERVSLLTSHSKR